MPRFGRRATDRPPHSPGGGTSGNTAARQARHDSRAGFLDAVQAGQETRDVTDRMEQLRRANHFGAMIQRTLGQQP